MTYDLYSTVHYVLDVVHVHHLGPKWHSPIGSMPFHRAQKSLDFQGPTPSYLPFVMDVARTNSITYWVVVGAKQFLSSS